MKLRQLFDNVASAAIGRAIGREVSRDAAKVAGKETGVASKTMSKSKAVAQTDNVDKKKNGMTIGVCFGRWNPPHKGHRAAWEIAAQNDTFYVGTNKNTEGPSDPLPYDVKLNCMETIWPEIKGHVVPEQSLFTLASKVFAKHGEGAHLKVATDEDWLTSSLVKYNGVQGAHGYYKFASIEQVPTPRLSSATALRAAVRAGDRDAFAEAAGVDANTPIRVGAKAMPFFDLVAYYLGKHPEKVKKIKEHKKGVRAIKYTKKPVSPSAQHAKAKEKLAPIKPGVEKQTDECAGVGTITKQNSTGDVNKGTPYKNLKAFNLVKEGVIDMKAVAGKAKQLLAQGMSEQQVVDQLVKQGIPNRYAQQAVQAAQMNEIAGAFPSPSTREKWAKDAAASNAAEAKRLADKKAAADAERLRVNNAIVDKEQRINYHPMPDNEVPTKEDNDPCWTGYHRVPGTKKYDQGSCEKNEAFLQELENEMLAETGMKPIEKSQKAAMKNASTLPALNMSTGSGGAYMNYRMGIALAGAPDFPTKMEADNWIGGDPLLSTYTEEEFNMIKAAAKQVGAGTIQNWSGKRSEETADVNKTSTVAKIKRNKYGV